YIEAVQTYNATIRRFPVNLTAKVFGHDLKPNFTVEDEAAISAPPVVEFDTNPAAPAVPPATEPAT
ncbi:MAG TPA: LemA family protein, partial [Steroidobacteraceae bacterium]|nr:LemA family protein [Steroidobacteraceae bacterium]